jgi:histone H3/H4
MFEAYISPLLKEVSPGSGIQEDAKQQLNSALQVIARELTTQTILMTEIGNKRTIFPKEVENAIRLKVPGDLQADAIAGGAQAVEQYRETEEKEKQTKKDKGAKAPSRARQAKAGITVPPSVLDKFLRQFGYSNVLLNGDTAVFFAGAIERIGVAILSSAAQLATEQKKKRITVRNLKLGVEGDEDLAGLFKSMHLSFLGGGVAPFVHKSLCAKKAKRRKPKEGEAGKKPHRYRPGTVSLRLMKKMQGNDEFVLAKAPFEKCVRAAVARAVPEGDATPKIGQPVFIILQHFVEQQVTNVLRQAMFAAIHAGRRKLMPVDIALVRSFLEGSQNPYATEEEGELDLEEEPETVEGGH